jgi:arabinose-5-phosphate isomerase
MEALAVNKALSSLVENDDELDLVGLARMLLEEQAMAVGAVAARLDVSFAHAVELLLGISGRVVVTGIGKSGHVGQKIAATLASTGTPSFFVHSAEAAHGDLGMITREDAVMLLSYSGETDEALRIMPSICELGVPTIAMVGNAESRLAKAADVVLDVSVRKETCPNNLAPTSSTLATMAMGDTLAVTLARLRQFRAEDFARIHPGGALGKRLTGKIRDCMLVEGLPVLTAEATVEEALLATVRGRLGVCFITDSQGHVLGALGPRELELALGLDRRTLAIRVANSDHPSLSPDSTMEQAVKRIRLSGMPALPVVDAERRLLGVARRDD